MLLCCSPPISRHLDRIADLEQRLVELAGHLAQPRHLALGVEHARTAGGPCEQWVSGRGPPAHVGVAA